MFIPAKLARCIQLKSIFFAFFIASLLLLVTANSAHSAPITNPPNDFLTKLLNVNSQQLSVSSIASNGNYTVLTGYICVPDTTKCGITVHMFKDQKLAWSKTFFGTGQDIFSEGLGVTFTAPGVISLVGTSGNNFCGANYINNCTGIYMQLDTNGKVISAKKIIAPAANVALAVTTTNDGGVVLSGATINDGCKSTTLISLDRNSQLKWANTYKNTCSDAGRSIASLDGANGTDYIITGEDGNNSFVLGVNKTNGAYTWGNLIKLANGNNNSVTAVAAAKGNPFATVVGTISDSNNNQSIFLANFNNGTGKLMHANQFANQSNSVVTASSAIQYVDSGTIAITGIGSFTQYDTAFLMKLNADNFIPKLTVKLSGTASGLSLTCTITNTCFVTGFDDQPDANIFLAKFNDNSIANCPAVQTATFNRNLINITTTPIAPLTQAWTINLQDWNYTDNDAQQTQQLVCPAEKNR